MVEPSEISDRSGDAAWLGLPLLRLLAGGEPVAVAVAVLAEATGRPAAEVRDALAGHGDIEYDEDGRIVGNGLTLNPTPHRFEVAGRQLYTWCALDTLAFPGMLDASARVESVCHATGTPIRLTAHPDMVTDLDPPTAVVSFVEPTDSAAIRTSFCDQVHFFATPEAAQGWLAEHPGGEVLPVADAQTQCRSLITSLPLAGGGDCC